MKWRAKEHGTESSYQAGCRCDDCRAAHSRYNVEMRRAKRKRPPGREFGTAREQVERMMAASAVISKRG